MKNLLSSEAKMWLQKSLGFELTASHAYNHLGNHSQRLGLFGFEKYFRQESADELTHAKKLTDFINDMGDVADMPSIEAITFVPNTGGEMLDFAYDMEYNLGVHYKDFYNFIEEQDIEISQFLLQFIEIQRKAVGEYGDLQARYAIADKTQEILLFDEYMDEA